MLIKLYDFLIALLILSGLAVIVYIFINKDVLFSKKEITKKNNVFVENLYPVQLKVSPFWLKYSTPVRNKKFFSFNNKKDHLIYAADLNDPSQMILVGDYVIVTEPKSGNIVVLLDNNKDNSADEKFIFESGLRYPYGLAYYKNDLYVAAEGSILVYKNFLKQLKNSTAKSDILVSELPTGSLGKLRPLLVGPNEKIYVAVGSSCNSCIEEDKRRASVVTYNLDGSNEEIFAFGFRNPTDLEYRLGFIYLLEESMRSSKIPIPHELNKLKKNSFYGWPALYGNNVPIPETPFEAFKLKNAVPPLLTFEPNFIPSGLGYVNNSKYSGFLISLNSLKESKILYYDLNETTKDLFVWKDSVNKDTFVPRIQDIIPYKKGILVADSKNGLIYYLAF